MNIIVNFIAFHFRSRISYEQAYVSLKRIIFPMAIAGLIFLLSVSAHLFPAYGKIIMLCMSPFVLYAGFIWNHAIAYPPGKGIEYCERYDCYTAALLGTMTLPERLLDNKTYKYYRIYIYKHPKGDWVLELEYFIKEKPDEID